MKSPFLKKACKENSSRFKSFDVFVWAAFHGAVFFALGVLFLCGRRFGVNTNLFDILPESSSMKSIGEADRALSAKNGRQFFVLVQSESFESAKSGAERLRGELSSFSAESGVREKDALFESVSLGTSERDLDEIFDFFYRNRFLLLDEGLVAKINSPDGISEIAEDALEKAYGGFSMMPLEYISGDPFFLTEHVLENFLAGIAGFSPAMALRDGVLCAEYEGKSFVMLRGTLTNLGASITNRKSGVKKIYERAQEIQSQVREIEFVFSGVPFHSYKSSSSAQKEIAIISTLSMIAVALLFIFIFKSALPIICSVAATALCALTALCATLLAFGQIHILCFVFGTTLIGICLDYSVHFFVRWKGAEDLQDGIAIRKKLLKGFLLSFASTEICYLILFLAPFSLLKQIAIFSFVGVLSSFLTVVLLYPGIPPLPKEKVGLSFLFAPFPLFKRIAMLPFSAALKAFSAAASFFAGILPPSQKKESPCRAPLSQVKAQKVAAAFFALALISVAFFHRKNLRIENDLRSFYKISGKMLDDEILCAKVLKRTSSGWYFIVRGNTPEGLFENEKRFCEKLDSQVAVGNLASYAACSRYIPPASSQMKSWRACKGLLDVAGEQLALLGFDDAVSDENALSQIIGDYEGAKDNLIKIGSERNAVPSYLARSLSSLYIGELDGEWFSAILPLDARDSDVFKKMCVREDNVFFVNKMEDIENELNRLTRIMLSLLGAAFVVLLFALRFFYPLKTVLKVARVPLAVVLAECAALAAFDIPIGFFSVTAIILVFGLGLDYIIYTVESAEKLNTLAVLISFATTELSFGAIALSSFAPVHIFGAVVFAGLLAAVLSALF